MSLNSTNFFFSNLYYLHAVTGSGYKSNSFKLLFCVYGCSTLIRTSFAYFYYYITYNGQNIGAKSVWRWCAQIHPISRRKCVVIIGQLMVHYYYFCIYPFDFSSILKTKFFYIPSLQNRSPIFFILLKSYLNQLSVSPCAIILLIL